LYSELDDLGGLLNVSKSIQEKINVDPKINNLVNYIVEADDTDHQKSKINLNIQEHKLLKSNKALLTGLSKMANSEMPIHLSIESHWQ
jgi:hypothetical protein